MYKCSFLLTLKTYKNLACNTVWDTLCVPYRVVFA
nr:MAG TPA: hypothetical protein [Caudoviricetes sp.]